MYKMVTYGQAGRYKWRFMYNNFILAASYTTYASKSAAIKAFDNFIEAVTTKDFAYN